MNKLVVHVKMGANNSSFLDGDTNRIFPTINSSSAKDTPRKITSAGDSFELNITTPVPNRIQLAPNLSDSYTEATQENSKPKNPIISANSMRFTKIVVNKDILNQNLFKADTPDENDDEDEKKEPTSTLLSQISADKLKVMMRSSFEPNIRQLNRLLSILPEDSIQKILDDVDEDVALLSNPEVTHFEGVILGIRLVGISDAVQTVINSLDQISARKLGFEFSFSKQIQSTNIFVQVRYCLLIFQIWYKLYMIMEEE